MTTRQRAALLTAAILAGAALATVQYAKRKAVHIRPAPW